MDALIATVAEPHGIDNLLDDFALVEAVTIFLFCSMFLLSIHISYTDYRRLDTNLICISVAILEVLSHLTVLLDYLLVLSTFELIEHLNDRTGLGFKLASSVRSMVGDLLYSRSQYFADIPIDTHQFSNVQAKNELNFLFFACGSPGLATQFNLFNMIREWSTSTSNKAAVKADCTRNACLADIVKVGSFRTRPRCSLWNLGVTKGIY